MRETGFVPSVPLVTVDERRWARGYLNEQLWAEGRILGTPIELPPDVTDIFDRDSLIAREHSLHDRDRTAEIPERMLDDSKPMTIDDVVKILHVYFWWSDVELGPARHLQNFLEDLNDERFIEATRLMHSTFTSYCETTFHSPKSSKPVDGFECFKRYIKKYSLNDESIETVLASGRKRGLMAAEWLYNIVKFEDEGTYPYEDDDNADDYGNVYREPSLTVLVREIGKKLLVSAGVDDMGASYLDVVLDTETNRRFQHGSELSNIYTTFRDNGGTPETANEYLAQIISENPELFMNIVKEYEDVPISAFQWSSEKRFALARRHISANADLFRLYETSYQWRELGALPTYVHLFAEEKFPVEK